MRGIGVVCYKGSEDDVLKRVYSAAKTNGATVVVELTGDCPLIDPIIVDQMIAGFFANQVDYHTNTVKRSYPDGMDVQVMSIEALEKAFHCSSDPYDREHVTPYIYNNPDLFKISHQISPKKLFWPGLGLTLDEKLDYDFLSVLVKSVSNPLEITCEEIVAYINTNPSIVSNYKVKRKQY